MKKLLLLVAVVLAFSFTALAQGAGASGSQTGTEPATSTTKTKKSSKKAAGEEAAGAAAAKEHTMTGCLAKDASGSGFVLTNARHKKGVEVKSSEDLSAHVGHKVKLTGTIEKAEAGAKGESFNATKIDHIADTCAAGAAGKTGGKKAAKTGTGK